MASAGLNTEDSSTEREGKTKGKAGEDGGDYKCNGDKEDRALEN
jgi:hypothetical protein